MRSTIPDVAGARRWTAAEDAALRRLWHGGAGPAEIAERLRVSRNSVLGRIRRLGLTASSRRPERRIEPQRPPGALSDFVDERDAVELAESGKGGC